MPDINASITLTAKSEGTGLLISLKTDGDFSGEMVDCRFYSIPQLPPSDLASNAFWAPLLADIGKFLTPEDGES